MMSRCEECGQEKPPTDNDILAYRLDAYRSAYGVLKDLWKDEPSPGQVEFTARFLAGDKSPSLFEGDGDDDDD